jgi:hypothetical protein
VTINDLPFEIVAAWEWPLYRGFEARPVTIFQGSAFRDVWADLQGGPHRLQFRAPKEGGVKPEMEDLEVQGVYLDKMEMPDDETCVLRFYDARFLLMREVAGFDWNIKLPNGRYKGGTSASATAAASYGAIIKAELGRVGVTIDESQLGADGQAALQKVAPDNLQWAARRKLPTALEELLAQIPVDVTVDIEGNFFFVDSVHSTDLNIEELAWHKELPRGDNIAVSNNVPETVAVYFDRRFEFKATGYDLSASYTNRDSTLFLYQQYKLFGEYYDAASLWSAVKDEFAAIETASGGSLSPKRTASQPSIERYVLSADWRGTAYQTVPYDTKSPAEIEAAKFARIVTQAIRKDYRTLWRLSMGGAFDADEVDAFRNVEFGLLDDDGGIAQEVTRNNSAIGAVHGYYVSLYARPVGDVDFATTNFAALSKNSDSPQRPIPMKAAWEGDPQERLIRLTQDTARTGGGVQVVANHIIGERGIRIATANQQIALRGLGANGPTIARMEEWEAGEFRTGHHPTVYLVATDTRVANVDRFHQVDVATNIAGATQGVVVHVPATTGTYAAFQSADQSTPINSAELQLAANRAAQPVIESFTQKQAGMGTAHGLTPVSTLRMPRNQVQEMAITIWEHGENTILTDLVISDAKLSARYVERAKAASRANAEANAKEIPADGKVAH